MPVGGKVVEINEALLRNPELVNTDPFGAAWMIKVEMDNGKNNSLLSAEGYKAITGT